MSTSLAVAFACLPTSSPETLSVLASIDQQLRQYEQISIPTEHILHGGMYARTIRLQTGAVIMGSLVKRATLLVIHGRVSMLAGDEQVELEGYNVLAGSAGRKQLFVAISEVQMTMLFRTYATSIEDAEDAVFAEHDLLTSRNEGSKNAVLITGEL